ncbi:MAG: hypothetical protein ACTSUE_07945, partial [Promethearchaeota archaeon]
MQRIRTWRPSTLESGWYTALKVAGPSTSKTRHQGCCRVVGSRIHDRGGNAFQDPVSYVTADLWAVP